jgi:hypothetical protein
MKAIAWLILAMMLSIFGVALLFGQPALPTPMHREVLWFQPNPTNVGGYILRWGTNRLNISGVNSTSAVIKLEPGQQTLFLLASAASGTNNSEVVSNTVRLLRLALEGSTNGASGPWIAETNWTWSIFPSPGNKLWRTKLEWSKP